MGELHRLEHEAALVYGDMVLPRWNHERHGFASTLYGYVMNCFAFVDLLSRLSKPSIRNQTDRMVHFMEEHIAHRRLAHEIAIQMWRHALMHTGRPQRLIENSSQITYLWLLHWGREQLPRDQHMTLLDLSRDEKVLNMALFYLIEDLLSGAERLFSEAHRDARLARTIETTHVSVREYRFTRRP